MIWKKNALYGGPSLRGLKSIVIKRNEIDGRKFTPSYFLREEYIRSSNYSKKIHKNRYRKEKSILESAKWRFKNRRWLKKISYNEEEIPF